MTPFHHILLHHPHKDARTAYPVKKHTLRYLHQTEITYISTSHMSFYHARINRIYSLYITYNNDNVSCIISEVLEY